jgi:hypothetical protein
MPRPRTSVTYSLPDPDELPAWASGAVVVLDSLASSGQLAALAERFHLSRRAGAHDVVGVVAFLVAWFASELRCGLRPFAELLRGRSGPKRTALTVAQRLAGLVGRTALCSSSALSRALGGVDVHAVRAVAPWLLTEVPGLDELYRHPSVLTLDTLGQPWHVFDFDPSMTAFCHRDLPPETADRPAGARRTSALAAPGYAGRKRADVVFGRAIVSHAGAGTWVHGHVSPGPGDARTDLQRGIDAILGLLTRLGVAPQASATRLDGAYGGVPAMTALQSAGLPFVTRASQQLMPMPQVRARLGSAIWEFVPGAEVDGMRSVAELGTVTLMPADKTLREDGTPYTPVTVRAVVSRIPKTGDAGRGVVIGRWQYEVFLTTLAADAWPAAEVVALYHGRSTCENRYAQEDREMELDRTFSFEHGGQELATVLGMMVWNIQVMRSFTLNPPPAEPRVPSPREAQVDDRPCEWPTPEMVGIPTTLALEPAPLPAALPPEQEANPVHVELADLVASLPWAELLANRPGWTWDAQRASLRCPDGQPLHLSCVRLGERAQGKAAAYFSIRQGACRECPVRDACFVSRTHKTTKQINVTVEADVGARLLHLLQQLPRARTSRPRTVVTPAPHRAGSPSPPRGGHVLAPEASPPAPGPWRAEPPCFLPAAARRMWRDLQRRVRFHLTVDMPATAAPSHPLIADSPRARRHARMSWAERARRHALPPDAKIKIHAIGRREDVTALLGRRPARRPQG